MDSLLPFLYDSFIRSNMPVIPAFTPLSRLMASQATSHAGYRSARKQVASELFPQQQ